MSAVPTNPELETPPHDFKAEQAVLGSCLLHSEAAEIAAGIISPGDFYREYHREIAEALWTCKARNEPVDLIVVQAELRRRGRLEAIGGGEYLTALIGEVATAAHVRRYATIVAENAVLREMIATAAEIGREAWGRPENVQAALNQAQERFGVIAERRLARAGGLQTWWERGEKLLTMVEVAAEGPRDLSPQRLGIPSIDRQLGPLDRHRVCVIKAPQGTGKTHLCVNAMMHTAAALYNAGESGHVAVFSFESPGMYEKRALAWATSTDSMIIDRGFDGERQPNLRQELRETAASFVSWPVAIFEGPLDEDTLEGQLRRFARRERVAMVIIDFWQRLNRRPGRASVEEYQAMTNRFTELSNEFACPFLIASQVTVNRDTGEVNVKDSRALEEAATLSVRLGRDQKEREKYTLYNDKNRISMEFSPTQVRLEKRFSHVFAVEPEGSEEREDPFRRDHDN